MLVARQLAKSFGQIEALRGVSLNLVAGEISRGLWRERCRQKHLDEAADGDH